MVREKKTDLSSKDILQAGYELEECIAVSQYYPDIMENIWIFKYVIII